MDMTTGATLIPIATGGGGLSVVPPSKSPEAESETPNRIQATKPISFTNSNGVLKRHSTGHHAPPGGVMYKYKECLKNHAASLGGHAVDGCGEFMAAPSARPSEPTSLKCAACGCHRNFHRRDPGTATAVIEYHPQHRHHPLPPGSQSPPPISSSYYPGSAPHMLLALSGGAAAAAGDTEKKMNSPTSGGGRKRFRTKFRQEQKEKMYEFAEKVGWKMHKSNKEMVNAFCTEIGVERGVLKVWMHNNKNTFAKRSANSSPPNIHPHSNHPTIHNRISHSSTVHHSSHHHHHQFVSNQSNAPTNASSSSS